MKFEVRSIDELPEKGGLVKSLRLLTAERAIFVPAGEKALKIAASNLSSIAAGAGLPFKIHTRTDRERNGVWLYRDGDTS